MPIAVIQPVRKEDALEKIAKALQIANGLAGLPVAYQQYQKLSRENEAGERQAEQAKLDSQPGTEAALSRGQRLQALGITVPNLEKQSLATLSRDYVDPVALEQEKYKSGLASLSQKERYALENKNKLTEIAARGYQERLGESAKPKEAKLPANEVIGLNAAPASLKALEDIRNTIMDNQDSFGPVAGRLGSINPYNTLSKTIDAQTQLAAQNIAKALEGGKLSDQDIIRYRKMFPNTADTSDVALAKLDLLEKLVATKYNLDIPALKASGYNVQGLTPVEERSVKVGTPKKNGDLIPEANANSNNQIKVMGNSAFRWNGSKWVEM